MVRDVLDPIVRATDAPSDALDPPTELLLGGVVEAYLEAFERADADDRAVLEEDTNALMLRGIRAAYDDFVAALEGASSRAAQARAMLDERLQR